jgi:hypothetical protein
VQHELRVRTRPGGGEGDLEGFEGRVCDAFGVRAGELDAAVGVDEIPDLGHDRGRALVRGQAEVMIGDEAVGSGGGPDQVDEHQRALALSQVAVDLLAVEGLVADQVEQVVLDLERGTEVETEAHHGPQVGPSARPEQRAYPQRCGWSFTSRSCA